MAINYQALKSEFDQMDALGASHLKENLLRQAFDAGDIKPEDYSVQEAYEELVEGGAKELRLWKRNQQYRELRESAAVRREMFLNINNSLVSSRTMMASKSIKFIGDQLVTVVPTTNLDGERIPGLTDPGDTAEELGEGQPYGASKYGEDWIQTPALAKRGTKIQLTKEVIIGDKTGRLFSQCKKIGYSIGYGREIRILDMVLGLVSGAYQRKKMSAVDVYGDNSGDHNWDNLLTGNALVDWTDVEAAELLFEGLTDPNTGFPIDISGTQILVPSALKNRARHILGASEVKFVDNQANATTYQTTSQNLLDDYELLSSRLVSSRQGNSTTWYMGNFREAFHYYQAWPLTLVQAPADHPDDFNADIVAQWKASEMGVVVCVDPRQVAKFTQ